MIKLSIILKNAIVMNPIIYIILFIALAYTSYKYYQFFKENRVIPSRFFLSWSFITDVIAMLLISVAVFYAKYPLNDPTIFIAVIVGLILGMMNATIKTAVRKDDMAKS